MSVEWTEPPAPRLSVAARGEVLVGRLMPRLPPGMAVRLSGEPAVTADGRTLDAHVQLARSVRRRRGSHGLCEPSLDVARARYRHETLVFQWRRTPVARVRDGVIRGPGGPLRLRHYVPDGTGPAPLTVYLHGGGFTIGDLDTHDEPCRILCREAGMHVLAVDYRLAPEHPFPAALQDATAALRWAQAHAAELGADPARVGIGGDSAGANLATVIARETRGDAPPAAQLLIYPPTDGVTPRPSQALFGRGYFLDQADRDAFDGFYLGGTGVGLADPRVSPAYADDLSGMAPALGVTAGFDLLRDEAEVYFDAMERAGTPVRRIHVPAHGHGFVHMTGVSPGAHAAMVRIARAWREVILACPPYYEPARMGVHTARGERRTHEAGDIHVHADCGHAEGSGSAAVR
ncbi:MAG TPA: alpha/beta hydrolase, partial [Longimicrobium sp.]|uniref:alpha/beta hydrolase n=1 Tax=Longimicrobium sp. TaxID=2029185 RepID=UPI002ED8EC70